MTGKTPQQSMGSLLPSGNFASSPSNPKTPSGTRKNAVLGWFVVGFLAFAFLNALRWGFVNYPLVPIESGILIAGLVTTRYRRGTFGKGWFSATAIVGLLSAFSAIGAAQLPDGSMGVMTGGNEALFVPAILALIARIRANREGR